MNEWKKVKFFMSCQIYKSRLKHFIKGIKSTEGEKRGKKVFTTIFIDSSP